MHTLSKKIREAKANGTRWTPEQVAEAENLADAMLDDPKYREEVLSEMFRKESQGSGDE